MDFTHFIPSTIGYVLIIVLIIKDAVLRQDSFYSLEVLLATDSFSTNKKD
jgi:hypothetical protein